MHVLVIIGVFFVLKPFVKNPIKLITACILIGLIKELIDYNSYGLFSIKDMISNLFGIILAFTLDKIMF